MEARCICGNIFTRICKKCRVQPNNSRQCQLDDWKRHKKDCFKVIFKVLIKK